MTHNPVPKIGTPFSFGHLTGAIGNPTGPNGFPLKGLLIKCAFLAKISANGTNFYFQWFYHSSQYSFLNRSRYTPL